MTWAKLLFLAAFVVLLWNIHHLTSWSRKHMFGGTIFEDSPLDAPAWLENPWLGRVLAILVLLLAGGSMLGSR